MTSPPAGQPDVLTVMWYAQPDDLIGGWCVTPAPEPPSAGAIQIADFTRQDTAEHIAWLLSKPPGPVRQLRNIAEHDVGASAPYLADLINIAADRLEQETAGPGSPPDELIAVRRDDVNLALNLLDLAGADGAAGARARLSEAVTRRL